MGAGAKDILDNKVTSKYFYVKRYRTSKNRMKVSRRAKDGTWRARGQYKKITTSSRVNARIGVYEYVPKPKSQMCSGGGSDSGSKWIMEEFVLDRGENMVSQFILMINKLCLQYCCMHVAMYICMTCNKYCNFALQFEDYAIRKVRLPLGGKRKHAKKEADDGPKEKGSHGGGPQTNPPLPIGNCTRENSETGAEEDGKEEPKVESFLPVPSHVTETPWYEDYYSFHDDC